MLIERDGSGLDTSLPGVNPLARPLIKLVMNTAINASNKHDTIGSCIEEKSRVKGKDVQGNPGKNNKRQNRWLRFNLRFLFLAITIVAVYLGMLTASARQQRQIVAMVTALGGKVDYLHSRPRPSRPKEFDFKIPAPGPTWLRNLLGQDYFVNVVFIHLQGKNVTDEHVKMIAELPYLENLTLSDTQITDEGIAHLEKLRNLRVLWLSGANIGDDGIKHLAGLTNLVDLHLEKTHITDAGLNYLSGLINLDEWLNLRGTQVTDAGLLHLRGLKKLDELLLQGTKVSEDGAKTLHQYLPETTIGFGEKSAIYPAEMSQ